jgi:hypothetical protein
MYMGAIPWKHGTRENVLADAAEAHAVATSQYGAEI